MNSIQDTSLSAYARVLAKLSQRQQQVLEAIEEIEPCTNKEIARHLKWEINSVTPRCLELRKKKIVVKYGVARDMAGRPAIMWSTKDYADTTGDCN